MGARPPGRRSSSAIDRTDTSGRSGRLFGSVVAAERGPRDRHLPSGRVNTLLTIYEGAIERLYSEPPAGSVVICLDEMSLESAKSFAGQRLVDATKRPAERAKQEIDYARRGKGYIFGVFQPATARRSPRTTLGAPSSTGSSLGAASMLSPTVLMPGCLDAWMPSAAPQVVVQHSSNSWQPSYIACAHGKAERGQLGGAFSFSLSIARGAYGA
jgi:hypothetical protein